MSALVHLLYPVAAQDRTVGALLKWWEGRRLAFNLAVGGAGLVTLAAMNLLSALPPNPHPIGVPLVGILVYAVLANLCYTGGWVVETTLTLLWRDGVLPSDPVLYRQGMIFSVGLTLLPILVAGMEWIARVIGAILR